MSTIIDFEILSNIASGENSLLGIFSRNGILHFLIEDVHLELVSHNRAEAYAMKDIQNDSCDLITIKSGMYDSIYSHVDKCVDNMQDSSWIEYEWDENSFLDNNDFKYFLSNVIFDLVILHELSHIARGHLLIHPSKLFEVCESRLNTIESIKSMALEIDADSCLIYIIINLYDFIINSNTQYKRCKNQKNYIILIGVALKMLFSILDNIKKTKPREEKSLIELHKNLTHPIPSIRDEFATHRVLELATSDDEKKLFTESIEKANDIFIQMVSEEIFPKLPFSSWAYSSEEVTFFLNMLIEKLEEVTTEINNFGQQTRINSTFEAFEKYNASTQENL